MVDVAAAQQDLALLAEVAQDARVLTRVVFGLSLDPEPVLIRVATDRDVETTVRDGARRWIASLAGMTLVEYDLGHRLEPADIGVLEVADEPAADDLVAALVGIANMPELSNADTLGKVEFIVTTLTDRQGQMVSLVKRVTSGRFLLREGRMHRLVFRDRTFTSVEEDIVQFDDEYHFALAGSHLFIGNQFQFESLFDYIPKRLQLAQETVRGLATQLPVSNESLFVEYLSSDRRYFRKLESVRRRGLLGAVTFAELEEFCVAKRLGFTFAESVAGGRVLLVQPGPEWRRSLLALLDDDNLNSNLSGSDYEANSKRRRP